MPFQVVCPQCLAESLVSDEHAGARGRCKACRGKVRVPSRDAIGCAECGVELTDVPVVTDEQGHSYCKVCWLDEIEPQRRASEQANIVGCALCGDLFPADQVRQFDNVFACAPCAQRAQNPASSESEISAKPLATAQPAPNEVHSSSRASSSSVADRSPVLKLARGLLRGMTPRAKVS
jgi:hypothetical protein